VRSQSEHPKGDAPAVAEDTPEDGQDEDKRLSHHYLNLPNPQHTSSSLEQAAATMMRQMLFDVVKERKVEGPIHASTPSRTHSPLRPVVPSLALGSFQQAASTNTPKLPPDTALSGELPPPRVPSPDEEDDSWFEDDLPTLKISIMDTNNTNLPVMVHIGYKSDCFLVFLRSISGTTIDIKLNLQQIVIKGTLPPLETPLGVEFKGPMGGQFGTVIDFCDNIDVTRVTRKVANQTLVITLPKATPGSIGTQVF